MVSTSLQHLLLTGHLSLLNMQHFTVFIFWTVTLSFGAFAPIPTSKDFEFDLLREEVKCVSYFKMNVFDARAEFNFLPVIKSCFLLPKQEPDSIFYTPVNVKVSVYFSVAIFLFSFSLVYFSFIPRNKRVHPCSKDSNDNVLSALWLRSELQVEQAASQSVRAQLNSICTNHM